MPQRNSFKTDSSFFRMLAVGAVGAKAVRAALNSRGHEVVELERGSLSTRIWRDVKRKRVRIPDLCCTRCGVRVESRAKTRAGLTMSHSPRDAERAWDYGMLGTDWIAFPVLAADENVWSQGSIAEPRSLWRERVLTSWSLRGTINFFGVAELRSVAPKQQKPKGVTEGSEVQVSWKARFAKTAGTATSVRNGCLNYKLKGEPKDSYFRLGSDEKPFLEAGDEFAENEVVAGQIRPLSASALRCTGDRGEAETARMLRSRERTVRFTGCKLARLNGHADLAMAVRELANDPEEDPYVQMEARAYLCEVAAESADDQFRAALMTDADHQMRLESAVTLAEVRTPSSFELLLQALEDTTQPLFLRSACAWAIGCHGTRQAAECLVRAFGDVAPQIRKEALSAVAQMGTIGLDPLLKGLSDGPHVAAGSAEALRRLHGVTAESVALLAETSCGVWPTWTLAHLPKDAVVPHIAALQRKRPDVHFAVTVLWAFLDSWIAEDWTPRTTP